MIVALAVLMITQPLPTPKPRGDDIIVTGPPRTDWRAVLVFRGDAPACRTTRSTSDGAVDSAGCDAMSLCFEDARPMLALAQQAGLAKAARKRRLAEANRTLSACFATARATIRTEAGRRSRDGVGATPDQPADATEQAAS